MRLAKKISKWLKKLLLRGFYLKKAVLVSSNSKPQIVVCFDGKVSHGGLVDRLKGIISFYEISKILDFDFKLIFNHPFELSNFLEPNLVDWKADSDDEKFLLFSSKILYLVNEFNTNPLKIIQKSKSKRFFVYSNVDYLAVLYPEKSKIELDEIWRNNYNELFKLSDYLKEKLDFFPSNPYAVFHTRFTSIMGDFSDSVKLVLNENEKQILLQNVIECIDRQVALLNNKEIFILSDSSFFLENIKKRTTYSVLEGTPKHLEFGNVDLDFHAKTFIDFYFMINSREVFLIKKDKMYNSNFSKYAAIIGNSNFKVLTQ